MKNREADCKEVVVAIKESGTNASAAIAHPTGLIKWVDMMTPGTSGTEVISGGHSDEEFWRQQISRARELNLASARAGSDAHGGILTNSNGTWVYCPEFASESESTRRADLIAKALAAGRTAATEMGSLAFIRAGEVMPGGTVQAFAGSKLSLGICIYPVNKGSDLKVSWNLYSDRVLVNQAKGVPLRTGESRHWEPLDVVVEPGRHGLNLAVKLEYLRDSSTELVFCGPLYVYGLPPTE